jgi:hypothetical protein
LYLFLIFPIRTTCSAHLIFVILPSYEYLVKRTYHKVPGYVNISNHKINVAALYFISEYDLIFIKKKNKCLFRAWTNFSLVLKQT